MVEWEEIELGNYIDVLTDYHANGSYKKLKENVTLKSKPDYALMIRTLNFERNDFTEDLIYINKEEYNFLSKSKVKTNDILMNKIANAGSVYIMPELNRPVSLAMNLFLIRFNKHLNQRFMYYLMKTNENYIKSFANGAATSTITKESVKNLKLKIPPLPIQKKIASILSAYDDLIENNLKRIKLLEELAQKTYEEWFVKFTINGEKLPINEETGLPDGWFLKRSDEIFNIKIGKTPPREQDEWFKKDGTGIKWASIKDINNASVFISETSENITKEGVEKFNMNIAKKGTVILSFKLTVGKVTILTENMVTNEAIAHFNNLNDSKFKSSFIYCYLKNFNYDSLGSTSSIGTAINSKIVKAMPFLIPDDSTLNKFQSMIDPIFNKLEKLLKQNKLLKEARDILLPRLMNRTIEVKETSNISEFIELAIK